MVGFTQFDPSIYLDNEETIVEYLSEAFEDEDPEVFLATMGHVAKARGLPVVAQECGLSQECLNEVFTPGAKPRYETVQKILRSLGVKISITANHAGG